VTDAFTAAQKLTAAFLNGMFKGGAGWEPYTPVWSSNSGTPPAIGNGLILGAYAKSGRWTIARTYMVAGATSTYGSAGVVYTWSLPAAAPAGNSAFITGDALFIDTSISGRFARSVFGISATAVGLHSEAGVYVTPTAPFTWAVGDSVMIQSVYEAAS
jgi:hypothetical protein